MTGSPRILGGHVCLLSGPALHLLPAGFPCREKCTASETKPGRGDPYPPAEGTPCVFQGRCPCPKDSWN